VAGNIGSGKTNLSKKLAAHKNWELYEEPFSMNPYLERFYDDMKAWSFHSQMYFMTHSFENHMEISKQEGPTIQDRCLYENTEIFARNLYNAGLMSEHDWQTLKSAYDSIVKVLRAPDLLIYLKSSTERCLKNVKKRGREIDKDIDARYMQFLNNLYDEWIGDYKLSPIITIDMDEDDLKYNEDDFMRLVGEIDKFGS